MTRVGSSMAYRSLLDDFMLDMADVAQIPIERLWASRDSEWSGLADDGVAYSKYVSEWQDAWFAPLAKQLDQLQACLNRLMLCNSRAVKPGKYRRWLK